MKATLSNYRQSPRKVRLVADSIRGKRVDRALIELANMPKRASAPVSKVLSSALANAKAQTGVAEKDLIVQKITVDGGLSFVRFLPRARGRATPLTKRTSHIDIELAPADTQQ